MIKRKQKSSFRDNAGYVFIGEDFDVYRQINLSYKEQYDNLMHSGLYETLVQKQYLVEHKELEDFDKEDGVYKIIKPKQIPFISYSYEWTFSQLKEAALLTIEIQEIAIEYGMTLKDASSFNVQFDGTKPIFIDTLSFEILTKMAPWVGYKQFCQHFLAPLLLMSKVDNRLNQLCKNYIDGIPLELAANLLPFQTKLNLATYIHIFLQSKFQLQTQEKKNWIKKKITEKENPKFKKIQILGILDSLKNLISGLKIHQQFSEWENYYKNLHYLSESEEDKVNCFKEYLECIKKDIEIEIAIDIGSNNGYYSNIIANHSKKTISIDWDMSCIEYMYKKGIKKDFIEEKKILPLVIDICNPSPNIGWDNNERDSFFSRKKFDVTVALAVTHHLVINNNLSIEQIANFLSKFSRYLIIEFVPMDDPMLISMAARLNQKLENYNINNFEDSFRKFFSLIQKHQINKSTRILYLMKNYEKI